MLRELRYLTRHPLNLKMPVQSRELLPIIERQSSLMLNVERLRLVAKKYNYLLINMDVEERDLFESKLEQIDQVRLKDRHENTVELSSLVVRFTRWSNEALNK